MSPILLWLRAGATLDFANIRRAEQICVARGVDARVDELNFPSDQQFAFASAFSTGSFLAPLGELGKCLQPHAVIYRDGIVLAISIIIHIWALHRVTAQPSTQLVAEPPVPYIIMRYAGIETVPTEKSLPI